MATPEAWLPGQPVIVPSSNTSQDAETHQSEGYQ
ncbi:hypothetical protein [Halomonas sp. QHL1]